MLEFFKSGSLNRSNSLERTAEVPVYQPAGTRTAPTTPSKQSGLQWLPLSGGGAQEKPREELTQRSQSADITRSSLSSLYMPASTLPKATIRNKDQDRGTDVGRVGIPLDVPDHGIKTQQSIYSTNDTAKGQTSGYSAVSNVKSQQSVYLTGQNISSTLSQTLPRGFGASKDVNVSAQAAVTSVYATKRLIIFISPSFIAP